MSRKAISRASIIATLILSITIGGRTADAYSVLAHESIIDSVWNDSLKPTLLKRFRATPEELKEARAYAYGGSIVHDMGYYPFGSKLYSDLVHYVRSGDFIEALLSDARDLNEYAFALGALAHYAADNDGHSMAVNPSVAILYPKLRSRYGSAVTYEDNPSAHLKTEFGFDVVQLARGRYAKQVYHDVIGFKISKPAVERAFVKAYGIQLKDIFASVDLAIGRLRRAVSTVSSELTKVAWEMKKDEIQRVAPNASREDFIYSLSRESDEKEWGKDYGKPGAFDKALAAFLSIMPKVGPLKPVAFKEPTTQTEQKFVDSFEATVALYRRLLTAQRAGRLELKNLKFDTGRMARAGEY